jgi:hypothetical protein
LPWRPDSWPRLTYQSGCICSTTEPVSRACAWCPSTFFEMHRPGQHQRVGPQRDPSESAVIAHWGANPIGSVGKRYHHRRVMCCAAAPKGPPGRESVLLGGEMSPSGGQNEQKGLREGRIAALLPHTLGPGANEAALLPWRSDSWPRLTYQSGCICPTTEPVSRACAWCMASAHPFRNTPTGATPKGWSAEGSE